MSDKEIDEIINAYDESIASELDSDEEND
jgi:hypothetical protein